MGPDHEHAAIADADHHAAALGARIHRDVLADHGVTADHQLRRLAAIFRILWPQPDAGEGKDLGPRADAGDRKSVVEGKSVSVRVDLGGRRITKKQNESQKITKHGTT